MQDPNIDHHKFDSDVAAPDACPVPRLEDS